MKNLVILLLLVIIAVGGFYLWRNQQNAITLITSFEECVAAGNPIMESYPRKCSANGQTFTEQIAETPVPTPITSTSGNIMVTGPLSNQQIVNPVTITGQARVFENSFSYRIVDANGTELVEGYDMANAPDVGLFGPFSIVVEYSKPSTINGSIEVFSNSANDGSEINKVVIPVEFINE